LGVREGTYESEIELKLLSVHCVGVNRRDHEGPEAFSRFKPSPRAKGSPNRKKQFFWTIYL
jgi:hypothetical protein